METTFLAIERVLGDLAYMRNLRGLTRAWAWAFGVCYAHGWLDD